MRDHIFQQVLNQRKGFPGAFAEKLGQFAVHIDRRSAVCALQDIRGLYFQKMTDLNQPLQIDLRPSAFDPADERGGNIQIFRQLLLRDMFFFPAFGQALAHQSVIEYHAYHPF